MNTAERVITVIADQLAVLKADVTPDKKLVDDLGSDSLDTVEVMMAIEDEFGIEIPDEDWEPVVTVQHVLDYVEKRVAAKTAGRV